MSDYEAYCASIRLVVDNPGTLSGELSQVDSQAQAGLEVALRRDRELQARWMASDRTARDLDTRMRKLIEFGGKPTLPPTPPAQPMDLNQVEFELSSIAKEVQQLESVMDWIGRARRQVANERNKLH
ncbi:MAG: hypothetical protein KF742_02490 [Cryobacterium sp.]|nr:hypothetical protein [Cryobacterium sp.]